MEDADQGYQKKVIQIKRALNRNLPDVNSLRLLAVSKHGLVNDKLREKVWPRLLGVKGKAKPKAAGNILTQHKDEDVTKHKYYNQVVLDVNRSLKRFPPDMDDCQRMVLQDQLVDLIIEVLNKHDHLHYYQGYHDICVTFLLVVGKDVALTIINQLSVSHLSHFMERTMERTSEMLDYLYPIIGQAKPNLRLHMEKAELGTIFCLSWLITWFGHVLSDFRHVVRLYDFFLACHPLMPVYMAAAIVLHRCDEVMACECDMATLHCLLSNIPANLPYERLIAMASSLYVHFPPDLLQNQTTHNTSLAKSCKNKDTSKKESNEKVQEKLTAVKHSNNKFLVWILVPALTAIAIALYLSMMKSMTSISISPASTS